MIGLLLSNVPAYQPPEFKSVDDQVMFSLLVDIAAEVKGIEPHLIALKTRKREVVEARKLVCYMARQHTDMTLKLIGHELGGKDHTTVLSHVRDVIEEWPVNNMDHLVEAAEELLTIKLTA